MTLRTGTTHVLFMCPHSAGKSLLAATYFRAAAARKGLDVAIDVAGPDPDPHNIARVQAALEAQGFTIGWTPRKVVADDTAKADHVISIGCDHSELPAADEITEWEVPMLSEDFEAALQAIYGRAEAFAESLQSSAE